MNVLFLTLLDFNSIDEHNIYTDLLREFVKHGHEVYVISPVERRKKQKTKRSRSVLHNRYTDISASFGENPLSAGNGNRKTHRPFTGQLLVSDTGWRKDHPGTSMPGSDRCRWKSSPL